jgi:hypothetical protein
MGLQTPLKPRNVAHPRIPLRSPGYITVIQPRPQLAAPDSRSTNAPNACFQRSVCGATGFSGSSRFSRQSPDTGSLNRTTRAPFASFSINSSISRVITQTYSQTRISRADSVRQFSLLVRLGQMVKSIHARCDSWRHHWFDL